MSRGFGSTYGSSSSTDSIKLPTSLSWTNNTFSVAVFIYLHGRGGGNNGQIITNQGSSFTNFSLNAGSVNAQEIALSVPFSTTALQWEWESLPLTTWMHVAFTYNGSSTSNTPSGYINGVLTSPTVSNTPSGSVKNTAAPVYIGNYAGATNAFDGMIAHAAMWNGIQLSAGEILSLASGLSPLMIRPELLAFYCPLDGVNNPEPDLVQGCSSSITGTKLGVSDPIAESLSTPKTPSLLDMSIISSLITPWRRPGLTYRRITA